MDADDPSDVELLFAFITAPVHQFGLAIATADHPDDLVEVREQLRRRTIDTGVRVAQLEVVAAPVLDQLVGAARQHDVLFVTGLERLLLDRHGGRRFAPEIEQLNWDRDRLAVQLRARVVLWLVRPAVAAMAAAARDLTDVVLARYDVSGGGARRASAPPSVARSPIAPDATVEARLLDVLLSSHGNSVHAAELELRRGRIAARAGDLGLAQAMLTSAARSFDAGDQPRGAAVSYLELSGVLTKRDRADEALRVLRDEALPRAVASGDKRTVAQVNLMLSRHLDARGHVEEAGHVLRDATLPLVEKSADTQLRAQVLSTLAQHELAHGSRDEGMRLLREEVIPLLIKIDDLEGQVTSLELVATALRQRGELDEALQLLRDEALPIARKDGRPQMVGPTLYLIGGILEGLGRTEEARSVYEEEAIPLLTEAGEDWLVERARQRIAELGR